MRSIPPYIFWELDAKRAAARARGKQLLDFGIGSPDQPIPAPVIEAIRNGVNDRALSGYPHFNGHPKFLEAATTFMSDRFGVIVDPAREMIAVAGTKEGLAEIVLAICDPGDVVLVPEIHYPVYARATLLAGATPAFVPFAADGRLMLETLGAETLARARILIVNYPCNPTTAVANREELAHLVAFAEQHNLLLVSDLAYSELSFDDYVVPSVLEIPGAIDVAIEMHSCSKTFNMAGLRVGFVTGNADAIAALDQYRANVGYGVSTLPQLGAAVALTEFRTLVPPIVAEYKRRRDALVGALVSDGWQAKAPVATMYLWMDVPAGFSDWEWVDALIDGPGVVVTPGIAFGTAGAGKFRISLVQPPDVLISAVPLMTRVAATRK
ncbi:MAG: aminotransferase class I/II-fold pyridoxal phosphate-dependent enzyme [Gemmatimonadota bacterium]|nr:aminotransferase class I/II-fold pyridoxal phosphate-dependent enzyme [Gemmatimonadota bacterium]